MVAAQSTGMAQESVLIPNAPVFLVQKGWLNTKNNETNQKAWNGKFRAQSLYGISMKIETPREKQRRAKHQQKKVSQQLRNSPATEEASAPVTTRSDEDSNIESKTYSQREHLIPSGLNLHPSAALHSAFTSRKDWQSVASFGTYLNYYMDVIAPVVYPIENYVRTSSNPLREFWVPLALTDSLLLKAVINVAVVYRSMCENIQKPDNLRNLTRTLLHELNDRISTKELSEATIGAVSCLATIEARLGNFAAAAIHLAGMAEMLRLKDNLPAIAGDRRMKIWKADLVYSMDLLHSPYLSRPPRSSQDQQLFASRKTRSFPNNYRMFTESKASPAIVSVFEEMQKLGQMLEDAWTIEAATIHDGFYEDVICIQHDLLVLKTYSDVDEIIRLALVIFSKPFNRAQPYSTEASSIISKRLRDQLQCLEPGKLHQDLDLWVHCMGGLVSRRTPERVWFNDTLGTLRKQYRIQNWNGMKSKLQEVCWTSPLHDHYGKSLYDDLSYPFLCEPLPKVLPVDQVGPGSD